MKKNRYLLSFIIMFTAIWTLSTLAQVESSTPLREKGDEVFAQSANVQKIPPMKEGIRENYSQSNYENFVLREKLGEIPFQGGLVDQQVAADALVNNNTGYTSGSGANFTQSETSIIAFGSNVLIGFNDSGSNSGGANKFTGFSYSTNGGTTFTDGGTFPTNSGGDAGDPVIARNEVTGRIYFSTLGYSISTIQVFRSDNNGLTWMSPVNGTPGGSSEDKQWIAVDNFAGSGNGNVYLISRRFSGSTGIYMFRSTDNGNTFGPSGGVSIFSGGQGAFVTVGPDHSVYAFYYDGSTSILVRKSTDFGVTFGTAVTVFNGLTGGSNGDLGLTGIRQGTSTASSFRSNSFPHAAVNPVSGHIYVTFNDNPASTDKADVYITKSTDGGASWSARTRVNDDVTTTDQWQPTIAVTPNGANIGIFYYSRQEDAANNLFKYYGRTGTISGSTVTFTSSFAISDVASLPEFGRDAVINSVYMGDYNHASATANEFHVLWSDNRDDLPGGTPRKDPNVYYEKIILGPPCPVGAPSSPSPVDGAANVSISLPLISWTNGAGATQCEVWFGPSGSVTKVYDGSVISSWTIPAQLSYNTSYNWQIIDKNGTCSTSGSNWSFTTELSPGIVFTESFNNLNCWTAIGPLGTTNWSTQNTSNAGGIAPELRLNWTPEFNGLSKLKSCNISVISNRNYTVSFKHMIDWYANTAPTLGLGVSYDNGATYTSIWSITPTGNVGPQTITASFTTPVSATNLNFVLYCNGNSFNINYWYVDDILLNDDDYLVVANPTNVLATPISGSQIDLTFTPNSNNNNVVVVWNNTGTFATPSGTPPVLGQPFAGGTLLYNGTISPVNHTGLNGLTNYYYKLFSYNGTTYSPGVTVNAITLSLTDFIVNFLVIDNCTNDVLLKFGTAPGATDCYDVGLDFSAPPPPPAGAFDGRFQSCGEHWFTDIRGTNTSGERIWDVYYTPATGCSPVSFSWNPSQLPTNGYFHLVDPIYGNLVNVNMRTRNSYTDMIGLGHLQIKFNYQINSKYNVSVGWNMLSLPVDVSNNNYLTLFPNAVPGTLYGYAGTYFSTTSIQTCAGYWLKFPAAEVANVYGLDRTECVLALNAGWNMIGGPNCNVPLSSVIDPGGIIIPGTLYGYTGTYSTATSIDGTKGYWIKTNAAGTITISCNSTPANNVREDIFSSEALADFGKINITDASETSQSLYFHGELNNNINIESFSMPPVPPPGSFDARLVGDYRLTESDDVSIQLQATDYPVSVVITNLNSNEEYILVEMANGVEVGTQKIIAGSELIIRNEEVSLLKITKQQSLPTTYNLEQNYPNPFNPSTTIKFSLPEATNVTLRIYNTLGQKVDELVNTNLEAGWYNYRWDANEVATGIYIYELRTDKFISVKKMLLLK